MKKSRIFVALLLVVAFGVAALCFAERVEKRFYPREYEELVTKYASEYLVVFWIL